MKNYKAILVLAGFCLWWLLIWQSTNSQKEQNQLVRQLEWFEITNDSLDKNNEQLKMKVAQLSNKSDSLMLLVGRQKHRISNLKRKRHEEISAIHHFTDHELFEYFSKLEALDSLSGK